MAPVAKTKRIGAPENRLPPHRAARCHDLLAAGHGGVRGGRGRQRRQVRRYRIGNKEVDGDCPYSVAHPGMLHAVLVMLQSYNSLNIQQISGFHSFNQHSWCPSSFNRTLEAKGPNGHGLLDKPPLVWASFPYLESARRLRGRCEMQQYRKRTVEIQAVQLTDETVVSTLEGKMLGHVGDWLITGVRGEQYPCSPDVFNRTYEHVAGKRFRKLPVIVDALRLTRRVSIETGQGVLVGEPGGSSMGWMEASIPAAPAFSRKPTSLSPETFLSRPDALDRRSTARALGRVAPLFVRQIAPVSARVQFLCNRESQLRTDISLSPMLLRWIFICAVAGDR